MCYQLTSLLADRLSQLPPLPSAWRAVAMQTQCLINGAPCMPRGVTSRTGAFCMDGLKPPCDLRLGAHATPHQQPRRNAACYQASISVKIILQL